MERVRVGAARRAARIGVVLVVLGLVAAACSSKGGSGSAAGSGSSTTAAGATTTGAAGEGPQPWRYPGSGNVQVGSGTTTGGVKCSSGVTQIPYSYAPPCVAKFTGSNGGATSNGVTSNEILIANRVFPSTANAAQVAAIAKQDGAALPAVDQQVRQTFVDHFNKTFELYGRKVVIQDVAASGNSTSEALNQGQAQACADADKIATQVHAFGELGIGESFTGLGGSGPFSVCAAQQHLVEFQAGAYFPESFYQQYNPYLWHTAEDCQRIAYASAEVIGKLMAGKKAQYAGDPQLKTAARKFGTYIPNIPYYLSCNDLTQKTLQSRYHISSANNPTFTYNLDISTFAQSAQQAVVQFKAAGVTTVYLACDPYSVQLLTQDAAAQDYHPEWFINGAAFNDEDTVAQSFDQAEVSGHLFGISQLGNQPQLVGPTSEPGKLYKAITGHDMPALAQGNYYQLVFLFDLLQAAGPDLTPENLARGAHALPTLGAPEYEQGHWTLSQSPDGSASTGDHTAISDARFLWWNANGKSPLNGKPGTYVEVFGGRRFTLGSWPSTLPALFQGS
jgi:hypothetical protein